MMHSRRHQQETTVFKLVVTCRGGGGVGRAMLFGKGFKFTGSRQAAKTASALNDCRTSLADGLRSRCDPRCNDRWQLTSKLQLLSTFPRFVICG